MFCKFLLDASSLIVGALHHLATPWLCAYHHHQHHHNHHHTSTCGGCSLLIENYYFHLDGKTEIISDYFCPLENELHPQNFRFVLNKEFNTTGFDWEHDFSPF